MDQASRMIPSARDGEPERVRARKRKRKREGEIEREREREKELGRCSHEARPQS